MDIASLDLLRKIACENAAARSDRPRFHGWGVVTKADAEMNGRSVVASPTDRNPFHADIHLPAFDGDDEPENTIREHARDLSRQATVWLAAETEPDPDPERGPG